MKSVVELTDILFEWDTIYSRWSPVSKCMVSFFVYGNLAEEFFVALSTTFSWHNASILQTRRVKKSGFCEVYHKTLRYLRSRSIVYNVRLNGLGGSKTYLQDYYIVILWCSNLAKNSIFVFGRLTIFNINNLFLFYMKQ